MATEYARNRVREVRDAAGLTQRQLADRADLTIQTISSIENGQSPTLRTAQAIAEALGASVDGLFSPEASSNEVEESGALAGATQPTAAVPSPQPDTKRTVARSEGE